MDMEIVKTDNAHTVKYGRCVFDLCKPVENIGVEPMTSSMPWKRSSQLS